MLMKKTQIAYTHTHTIKIHLEFDKLLSIIRNGKKN